ncbi:cytochrome b/b6 domain-containing protein [Aurantimonas sp. Leaf443]|uniref:cytochrome b n=1 Tax=Aurantimonas sp. Leaf443 TaxID=1736378 RepID=UPI000701B63C|nr:cytochrome b/b6 domain-containing protein [Aurantimonas sp. Leaf443]KQT87136.1 hypothetical protein ASG48_17390 [Aurantimonas sp. Leaf443]
MTPLSTARPVRTADGRPLAWSRLSILLHWLVVVLIVVQSVAADSMEALFDATYEGGPLSGLDRALGWTHIVCGSAILAAMAARLADRLLVGRPPHDAGDPALAVRLARVTHALLYALLLAMPVLGLLAWITGEEAFADLHTLLWTPLLVLVALHVAGALAQQFWFRTDALRRMARLRR